jgi:hypothetical protein
MPFALHSYRRFPVQCSVTYNAGPFQGQGTVWNLSSTGWRLSGDLPMRPGETLSLTITLPNEQRIEVPEAVVRWSRGEEFAVENLAIKQHTRAQLQHYVKRLVQEPAVTPSKSCTTPTLNVSTSAASTVLRKAKPTAIKPHHHSSSAQYLWFTSIATAGSRFRPNL